MDGQNSIPVNKNILRATSSFLPPAEAFYLTAIISRTGAPQRLGAVWRSDSYLHQNETLGRVAVET